jgi:acyl-CoA thioesterase FadM
MALFDDATTTRLRPRYEGSNIGTWIGFKHINYLAEEAVLEHFRSVGLSARSLYEDHGLCVEIVDLDTRISTGFRMDDMVEAVVRAEPADGELAFVVSLAVGRGTGRRMAARSKVRVLLRRDFQDPPAEPAPAALLPFVVERITRTERQPAPTPVLDELGRDPRSFARRWRIPYPYCHFSCRLQMSGYLRLLEEIVDLFLADRGLSIRRLLCERRWIPVVPHSSITVLDEVIMEEDLYTVFTVENIFQNTTFLARLDAYVLRDGALLRTASGHITHGYAEIVSRTDFHLTELDERVVTALGG